MITALAVFFACSADVRLFPDADADNTNEDVNGEQQCACECQCEPIPPIPPSRPQLWNGSDYIGEIVEGNPGSPSAPLRVWVPNLKAFVTYTEPTFDERTTAITHLHMLRGFPMAYTSSTCTGQTYSVKMEWFNEVRPNCDIYWRTEPDYVTTIERHCTAWLIDVSTDPVYEETRSWKYETRLTGEIDDPGCQSSGGSEVQPLYQIREVNIPVVLTDPNIR